MLGIDLLVALLSLLLTIHLLPRIISMLIVGGLQRANYLGEYIPLGCGIVIPLASLPSLALWQVVTHGASQSALVLALVVTGMAAAGLLDDLVGDGSQRGLRGHWYAYARGALTTGGCKVILGVGIAVIASLTIDTVSFASVIISSALVALSANFINMFDLRPGRALKVFYLGYALVALVAGTFGGPFLIVFASALALAPADLQARIMMGDTGANALGGVLGLFMAINFSMAARLLVLIALILLHFAAERWSFSRVIAAVPMLSWLDKLGRH